MRMHVVCQSQNYVTLCVSGRPEVQNYNYYCCMNWMLAVNARPCPTPTAFVLFHSFLRCAHSRTRTQARIHLISQPKKIRVNLSNANASVCIHCNEWGSWKTLRPVRLLCRFLHVWNISCIFSNFILFSSSSFAVSSLFSWIEMAPLARLMYIEERRG